MDEIWEIVTGKLMHGLYVCLIVFAGILLTMAIWHLIIYFLTRNRIEYVKRIYNAIKLDEPMDTALSLFRGYSGSKDKYTEEALLTNGKHEVVLCLLFGFSRGEMGEIRLTYIDDRLVQKQQNGIW